MKFAHVINDMLEMGLVHLDYPRCIMWYQIEEIGTRFQWLDMDVSIADHIRVKLLLEEKDVELAKLGLNPLPVVEFGNLMKS